MSKHTCLNTCLNTCPNSCLNSSRNTCLNECLNTSLNTCLNTCLRTCPFAGGTAPRSTSHLGSCCCLVPHLLKICTQALDLRLCVHMCIDMYTAMRIEARLGPWGWGSAAAIGRGRRSARGGVGSKNRSARVMWLWPPIG